VILSGNVVSLLKNTAHKFGPGLALGEVLIHLRSSVNKVAGSYFGEDAPPKESYVHPITRVIWSQKRFMCNLTQFADALSHFPSVNTGRVHFLLASDLHSGNVCSSTCTGCHRFGYLVSSLLVP